MAPVTWKPQSTAFSPAPPLSSSTPPSPPLPSQETPETSLCPSAEVPPFWDSYPLPAMPLTIWRTLGKSLSPAEPRFPPL